MADRIILGSGKLYVVEAEKDTSGEWVIPADSTIEVEDNRIGWIKNGASISYTPSWYEAKDDLKKVSKSIITDEEAILTAGVMTINAAGLNKLISNGTLTTTTTERKLKMGGMENYNGKQYVVHFLHEDAVDGDIRVTIIGHNESGLEIQWQQESETVVNAQFKAIPNDSDGTLIIYREEIV